MSTSRKHAKTEQNTSDLASVVRWVSGSDKSTSVLLSTASTVSHLSLSLSLHVYASSSRIALLASSLLSDKDGGKLFLYSGVASVVDDNLCMKFTIWCRVTIHFELLSTEATLKYIFAFSLFLCVESLLQREKAKMKVLNTRDECESGVHKV